MINVQAVLAQATFTVLEDNKGDAANASQTVQRNSDAIDVKRKESAELTDDMRGVRDDAKDMQEKADDTKWLGRFFGVKKSREKDAAALSKQATNLEGEVEKKELDTQELRDDSKDKLDAIQASNEDSSNQSAFLNKVLNRAFVVKP